MACLDYYLIHVDAYENCLRPHITLTTPPWLRVKLSELRVQYIINCKTRSLTIWHFVLPQQLTDSTLLTEWAIKKVT